MNWSYIAGLFDGEGHFSICLSSSSRKSSDTSVRIIASISGENEKKMQLIKNFLNEGGIFTSFGTYYTDYYSKNIGWQKGKATHLQISSFDGVTLFVNNIYNYLIFKKPQCEIVMRALKLKKDLKAIGRGKIKENIYQFDELRHELHKYARKGPKQLKSWL